MKCNECLEGMVGRKSMSVSTSEALVQYTGAEFKGHPTWTSHIGTTVWSITVIIWNDCIWTEYRRIEEHSTWKIASQIAALCNHCKDKWHCLSISGFQLPQITVRKCTVWQYYYLYRHIALHISTNSSLHICVLNKEILKFILIICGRFVWEILDNFTIFFQHLYHENTDTREIPNPLLLVMLWDLMNRWVLFNWKWNNFSCFLLSTAL